MLQPQQATPSPLRNRLRDVPFLLLLVLVLVLSIVLVLTTIGSSPEQSSQEKVIVDFYGESLCPDCRHMMLDVLQPIMDNGLGPFIDLRYIAWGNVRSMNGDTPQCQHGELECLYNRYINCAQEMDSNAWFGYVSCLAQDLSALRRDDGESRAETCAKENGMSHASLKTCATGDKGRSLEKLARSDTEALVPKHTFVPWIVVNGAAIGNTFNDLDRYICAAIGGDLPEACFNIRDSIMHQG
jgi:interferon, gamma-inducible protein 30